MAITRSTRWAGALALGIAGIVGLAACASAEATPAPDGETTTLDLEGLGDEAVQEALQTLYDEAIAAGEKEVVIYGPSVGDALQPMWDIFAERFPGIEVVGVPIFGADLDARLTQEFASTNREGDLIYTGVADVLSADAREWVEPGLPVGADKLDAGFIGSDESFFVPSATLYAPLYNTDIIDEPPTSWADLLDARFTGEIMIADPTEANASSQFLSALMHDGAIDEAWLTSLVEDQDLVLGPPSSSGSVNSIVTGESGLLVGIGAKHYLNAKGSGAPVGFATGLEEGHYMLGYGVALLKDAPHPAAAKLVETWLLSTEGQEGVAATNDYGTMPGAPAPEGLPDMSSFNVILNPAPDEMDKVYPTHLALFQQLMR